MGFTTFSIACVTPQNRLSIVGILLLTSVNFRWIITQRLPSVSYLTFLDKYAIGCIILLGLLFAWDAVIGSKIISNSDDFLKSIERDVLYGFTGSFVLFLFLILCGFAKLYINLIYFNKKSQDEYIKLRIEKNNYAKSLNERLLKS